MYFGLARLTLNQLHDKRMLSRNKHERGAVYRILAGCKDLDIAAAFGFLLATFLAVKFLERRTTANLIWAGVGLGIALLLKFSTVLLIPFLFIIFF